MRRKASDLLVALALVHGADHLAGGQVIQDQRAPGGVVAVVMGNLPYRKPSQSRQPRRTRFEANTRRIPPRTSTGTSTGTTTLRGSASIRAAIRSSAISAAFSSSYLFSRRSR